jgi:ferredoxin
VPFDLIIRSGAAKAGRVARKGKFVRISVNRDKCQGHAQCNVYAAGILRLDDDGYVLPVPGDIAPDQEDDARKGVLACPERALEIAE